jgi:DNA recombination protein RmuC
MDVMMLVALLAGIALGAAFGLMRGKQAMAGAVAREQYEREVSEKTTLLADMKNAQLRMGELNTQLETSQRELVEARERIHIEKMGKEIQEQRLLDQKEEMLKMQERLKSEFKLMSAAMLEEMGVKFNTQSEKKLGELLTPMQKQLVDFNDMVTKSFTEHGKEQHTLKDVIGKIVLQTDSLSKALRGDVKAQGNWGEIMLERILEESGLRRDTDYVLQGTDMGLSGAEGNRLRPDVIVNLPDNKHIIIDSKVSLTAYDRYCGENDELARAALLKEFLRSAKAHINGLAEKRYQDIDKLSTPDFVMMFMPIEGAYSLAMQQDTELHAYAWGKRVVLVCPTTLFATLQTVASLWRIERHNQNAQEIARSGGALYDKFAGFVQDMEKMGEQMGRLQTSYDGAMGKLSKGRGNLIARVEQLKDLGATTSKALPKHLKDDGEGMDGPVLVSAEG